MRPGEENGPAGDISSIELLASLQKRARNLLADLTSLHTYLQSSKRSNEIEIRHFKNSVQSEVKSLGKIPAVDKAASYTQFKDAEDDEQEEEAKRLHVLRSSNLPFYEAVWSRAKRCTGGKALGKRMYLDRKWRVNADKHKNRDHVTTASTFPSRKKTGVLVDIIAENGLQWIKVSTVTEKRLLFDLAKEGWERYGDDSDSDCLDMYDEDTNGSENRPGLELVRLAQDLHTASTQTRIHHQHPRVRFILPNIVEGNMSEVDAVLTDLRATGAVVECGEPRLDDPASALSVLSMNNDSLFSAILPQPQLTLTPTLNIDCTILLALISDISHLPSSSLPPPPNSNSNFTIYHTAILRQISAEQVTPLLPTSLYPILASRSLVCTSHAATRMREIVSTMGTPDECARAEIFLAEATYHGQPRGDLLTFLRKYTSHTLPDDLHLPIKVIAFDPATHFLTATAPVGFPASIAHQVSETMSLSPINRSVFLYGWSEGIVTVTSNRIVAAGMEKVIDAILDQEEFGPDKEESMREFQGPRIWVCEVARSLVGKIGR